MNSRGNPKLRLLLNQNQGKQMMDSYLEKWRNAIGREVTPAELMSIEESITIVDEAHNLCAAAASGISSIEFAVRDPESPRKMGNLLTTILHNWLDEPVVGILPQSEYCGALKSALSGVLRSLPRLLTLDEDDVFVMALDSQSGFVVTYSTNKVIGSIYSVTEFRGWGKYVEAICSLQDM